jgi:hypothetical protein
MVAAESGCLGEVAECGLGESDSQVLLIEDGIVIVEEGQPEDPERPGIGDVHVHDLEQAEAAVALYVVLAGHRVVVAVDIDRQVGVGSVLRVGALAHEQVPQRRVNPTGVVPLEDLSEGTEIT